MVRVLFLTLVGSLLFMSGCGDGKKDDTNEKEVSASSIKVTKNAVKVNTKKEVSKENGGQFYYSYNKAGDSKESKEIDSYTKKTEQQPTTIDAYLNIRSPYERVRITLMIKRLSKDYIIKCSACHDDYANGVIGPSLLDKDVDFIYQRIIDFKTGKKKNALMKELVMQIDDEKLKSIAQEIANFNKEIRKMRSTK